MFYHILIVTNMFRWLLRSPSSGWHYNGTNTKNCQTLSGTTQCYNRVSNSPYAY